LKKRNNFVKELVFGKKRRGAEFQTGKRPVCRQGKKKKLRHRKKRWKNIGEVAKRKEVIERKGKKKMFGEGKGQRVPRIKHQEKKKKTSGKEKDFFERANNERGVLH